MKFSLSLLLGVLLVSTAAAGRGAELIRKKFETWGAGDEEGFCKIMGDEMFIHCEWPSLPEFSLNGYQQFGQNGYSCHDYFVAAADLEFFDMARDIFESPEDGRGTYGMLVSFRSKGQRYQSRVFNDYRVDEEAGTVTHMHYQEAWTKKIDATSVFKRLMNEFVQGRAAQGMLLLDENVKIQTVFTAPIEAAGGTYHGFTGLAECGARQNKFFHGEDMGMFAINNCILSGDQLTTVCDQTWAYTLLADGSKWVTTMKMIVKVTDLGKVYHWEGHITSALKIAEGPADYTAKEL